MSTVKEMGSDAEKESASDVQMSTERETEEPWKVVALERGSHRAVADLGLSAVTLFQNLEGLEGEICVDTQQLCQVSDLLALFAVSYMDAETGRALLHDAILTAGS